MDSNLKNQLTIQEGTKRDYLVLDDYHYLNTPLPPIKKIYTIRPRPATERWYCKGFQGPAYGHASLIAVIVYSSPLRDLRARTKATCGFFKQPASLSDQLKLINENILYVSRLVVDPRYRKLGLADWLWRETLKIQTIPIVESMTPLPVRKNWLERLGFQLHYNPTPQSIRKLKKAFEKAKLNQKCWNSPEIAQKRIDSLLKDDKIKLDRSLHHFLSNYRHREHMPDDIKRITFILSKIPYPNGYLIWFNPYINHNPVIDWVNNQHIALGL